MEREFERFDAKADDGSIYTVIGYQQFIEARTVDQPTQWLKGMKHYELDDGSPVNYVDAKTFKIVMTDQIIRKV